MIGAILLGIGASMALAEEEAEAEAKSRSKDEQLEEAKEIIRSLCVCLLDFDEDTIEPYKQCIDKAEAFLKE